MTGQMAKNAQTKTQDDGREVLASVAFCAGSLCDEWTER